MELANTLHPRRACSEPTMATTSLAWTFCRSETSENLSPTNNNKKIFKPGQKPDLLLNQRVPKSILIRRNKGKITRTFITPHDLSFTRTLCSYVDAGCLEDALSLFEKMTDPDDAFTWNVMIRGFTNNGSYEEALEFYHRMQYEGIKANNFTYPFVIKCCTELLSLLEGLKVHSKLIKTGLDSDVYICNALIAMYAKLGSVESAQRVFVEMPMRDLVSWNSMITGYVSAGDGYSSLSCLREMQLDGIKPDRFGIIGALVGCSLENCVKQGREIHCYVVRLGLELDIMVQTSLINMYCKCRNVDLAERLFNRIATRGVAAWNAMIGGYAQNDKTLEAFDCWLKMKEDDNIDPDAITMVNLVPACAQLRDLLLGKSIHGAAIRKGFLPHLVLETALIDMYGRCGKWELAEILFGQMVERSITSWNAMLAAYGRNGCHREALDLFLDLCYQSLIPDSCTIVSILPSYAEVVSLREGRQIHCHVTKLDFGSNTHISNAIVYMYAKCGDIHTARRIFDGIQAKDIVSWNTIIMGYAIHGHGRISLNLFTEMQKEGIKPNASTLVSILTSCSVSGMIEEGWRYFNSMKQDYSIDPGIEHYGCMVDLLGRTGNLHLLKSFIWKMPLVPTLRIWGSLLRASRNNGNLELAELAAEQIFSLGHDNTGCHVLLSNMYAEAGRWEDVERIRLLMIKEGLGKTIKRSQVELNSKTCSFINGDRSHAEANTIYHVLNIISAEIGESIYNPTISKFRPSDLLKKRTNSPSFHSVRLAVCFGLISTTVGTPVLIRKNARICESCHHAMKKTSMVTKREIVVGGSKMYHHFKDGKCCCGDYW